MSLEVSIHKKLKGFSLDVSFHHHGKCLGILGASGCGKSMTLKCIAGIEKPDQGRIVLNDRVLFDSDGKLNKKPQARKVGYLFQNYALFPNMTVGENIAAGIQLSNSEKAARVNDYIERFQLKGLEGKYPSQLSGGQQQRVALARILAYEPDMIMLDEPFSALDSFLKDSLQRELLTMLNGYSGDVIIVSHNRDEIYRFCDKLVIMDSGKQLLTGDTKEIFARPAIMEAAKLTGCKNISPIRKLSEYELLALDWDIRLRTTVAIEPDIRYVGIRAHNIKPVMSTEQENTIPIVCTGHSELPFEYEYMLKNKDSNQGKELWWKVNKKQGSYFTGKEFIPDYVTLPKEDLMLLK